MLEHVECDVTQYRNDPIKCIKHYDNVFHGRESMFIFCVFPVFSSGALGFPIDFSNWLEATLTNGHYVICAGIRWEFEIEKNIELSKERA